MAQIVKIPRVKLGTQGLEVLNIISFSLFLWFDFIALASMVFWYFEQVSKLGYGCMGLTGIYNDPLRDEEGISVIKHAFDQGITFFDTSDIYGVDHANEILVGKVSKWILFSVTSLNVIYVQYLFDIKPIIFYCKNAFSFYKGSVESLCHDDWLSFFILLDQALKQLPREKIQIATKFGITKIDSSGMFVKGTPEYVRSCCEGSLKRLGVEYIDLYYQHRVDLSVPIEDTVKDLFLWIYQ